MAVQADVVYRDKDQIVADLLASWQARIPDVVTTPDSVVRILSEVQANSIEGLYLAIQLLHDDMFVQTASALALERFGEQYGRALGGGTLATGSLLVSGSGGTSVPLGSQFAAPQTGGEALLFNTTELKTIPNPGIPSAPTTAAGSAGNVSATVEYAVTFTTAAGETAIGSSSSPLVVSSKQVNLTAIPLGGTGTVGRKIYRRENGGAWKYVATLANNSATTYTDNILTGSLGGAPPTDSTAEAVAIATESDEPGIEYNVAVGTITDVSSSISGVSSVTNLAIFSGGTDPEDIEEYRSKLLDFIRAPKTGSPLDIQVWAESISGVESATVVPNSNLGTPTNGHLTVYISGPGGTVPDGSVVTAVADYLASIDIANMTIHVATFTATTVAVTVDVTTTSDYVLADVTPAVQQAIIDYLASVPVAGTVYRSGIIAAIFNLPGVATVTISVPASDTVITAAHKATAGTITIT
jgi:uncharacterized phage protein gp47/JayE